MKPTISRTVLLYPGQGAYSPGLLRRLRDRDPSAAAAIERLRQAWLQETGEDLDEVVAAEASDIEAIASRSIGLSQLAIYATSLALHASLKDRLTGEVWHLGHSFGEIAALTCAGSWSPEQGARVLAARVRALGQVREEGRMTAVSTDRDRAAQLVGAVSDRLLAVAGHNGPGQVVVAGPAASVERLETVAAALSISATRLSSRYAFHSPMMGEVAEGFEQAVRAIGWTAPTQPVYSPILGRRYEQGDDLARLVAGHLTEPFDFGAAVEAVHRQGAAVFVECGGRTALTSAVRRTLGQAASGAGNGDAPWVAVACDGEPLLGEALRALGAEPGGAAGVVPQPSVLVEQVRARLLPELERMVREQVLALTATPQPPQSARPAPSGPVAFEPAVALTSPADGAAPGVEAVNGANGASPDGGEPVAAPARGADGSAPATPGSGGTDRQTVLAELVSLYATALEYPAELFEEEVELEGDLGVDSVKQTELLARAADRFGLPPQPSGFAIGKFPTLGHIADLIVESAA